MRSDLDQLLSRYDNGQITRRELLGTLTALAAVPRVAAAQPGIGAARQMNHVTVFVEDISRSAGFYQDLFGMPLLTRQDPGVNLDTGAGFLGIYPAPSGAAGSIHHFCLGLENFDADAARQKLVDRGVDANIRLRGETKELYFTDPDNITVQLQDVSYRGGVGPLGDRDPG